MRIFYASGSVPNGALSASRIWRSNLYDALVSLGHDVVEFEYDLEPLIAAAGSAEAGRRRFVERARPVASRELVRQVRRAHDAAPVDLFFSYFYSSCAAPEAIREIGSLGVTTVNWFCNGSYQLSLVEEIAPAYDACLVPERYRLDDYRRIGANPVYCQEAANPAFYRPHALPRDLDVVFVGARYGERPIAIRRLVDAGMNVRVFGPGWRRDPLGARMRRLRPRATAGKLKARLLGRRAPATTAGPALPPEVCGGVLPDDELPAVYSRAKIALGFSSVGNTHATGERITQIRLRDFEAPMSGAFYMVEDMPELAEFFVPGREVVTYRTLDELVEKCVYYLEHADERERIRVAGHERALRDHTWQRRLTEAFREVGLAA
jgi:spore maturation protein CgeB